MSTISDSDQRLPGDPRLGWARPVTPRLRHRRDGILPTTAAALSLPGETTLTATAARSGPPPPQHPLVAKVLEGLGPDQCERHTGRCPEVALLSRRLTAVGVKSAGQARKALKGARITTRHIREDGDPRHGEYARHCHSCTALLAHFGVRSISPVTDATTSLRLPVVRGSRNSGPASADAVVEHALTEAGWYPGRREDRAGAWASELLTHLSSLGHPHTVVPAAEAIWAEFGGLDLLPRGPGRDHVPCQVVVEPLRGLHWARTLNDLGQALDCELTPVGEAGHLGAHTPGIGGALLAVDREARIYCVDHTGDWYAGADLRTALGALLTGTALNRLEAPAAEPPLGDGPG
ncbi:MULTISPECIES: SUKH-3 domain-containing protein [unclassified Streptomyces]|uniref:SUKH-3 domain-containing protein n=1 Tax=unclassified Streptomyces TaxID=2593676 RepID=UPI0027E5161E|nr:MULTISPECIES: SUKH-3 domain-containing protein [unclassified Streptomyces]